MIKTTFNRANRGISLSSVLFKTVLVLAVLISIICTDALASGGPFGYIANSASNNISIIDTETNNITTTVNVGSLPFGVAVNPNGKKVYVANYLSNNVSVIDTNTNKVTSSINVGNLPFGIAINPNGTRVYVANYLNNTVSVINTSVESVIGTVGVQRGPCEVALSPDGKKVYVSSLNSNNISIIDTATNVSAAVNAGSPTFGIAVSPDGKNLYVTKPGSNSISVINTSTNIIIATLSVGISPWGVTVNPQGTKVFVTNSESNNVSVVNTTKNTVVATVNVGNLPCGIAVNSDGTKVYVVNSGSNSISIIDTATNNVTSTVSVGRLPVAFGQFIGPKLVLPVANFSTNVTSGSVPLSVQFNDSSKNATGLNWDFGDGTNSTAKNPVHTYFTARNYTVNLTASNVNGKSSKLATIVVQKSTPLITWSNPANISYGTPLSSTQLNSLASVPGNFVYNPAAGTVLNGGIQTLGVIFTPTDTSNYTTTSKNVSINVLPVAAFSVSPTTGAAPLKVIFTDKSSGSPNSWLWNFGDKGTSTSQNPAYTYSKVGIYNVSLTVKNAAGSSTQTISNQVSVTKR